MASEHHLRDMEFPARDVFSLSVSLIREENNMMGSLMFMKEEEDDFPLHNSDGKHV